MVIPIHKGCKKDDYSNYRPISFLNNVSKIFERIIYNKILSYIDKFGILYDKQYGFRPKHTAVEAIAQLVEKIKHITDTGDLLACLFYWITKRRSTQ